MAIQSQPSRIPEPFAGSGTKNTIPATNATPSASQAASWASGFPPECSQPISAGGCPVPRNDVNGALNQLSQDYSFRQDGGVWEWSALADYDASRVVRGSDGKLYWSVQQSGPSVVAGAHDPTADDGTYWTAVSLDDSNVVHKTGNETINDKKVFTDGVHINAPIQSVAAAPDDRKDSFISKYSDISKGDSVSSHMVGGVYFTDSNGDSLAFIEHGLFPSTTTSVIKMSSTQNAASGDTVAVNLYSETGVGRVFRPDGNGSYLLGTSDHRWGQMYSSQSLISTSDARKKTSPEPAPDAVLDAWGDVQFCQFKMLDSVAQKGEEKARLHNGLIAQQIESSFAARGLDIRQYGLFCWDEWNAEQEERDKRGNVVTEGREAGDMFSLRYEEALCMEAAYQRRRADRAEARIAALEERLAAIEEKLQ